eukprot:06088.XXX_193976_194290_1 [CDS] Oithona nana genome sequencing.
MKFFIAFALVFCVFSVFANPANKVDPDKAGSALDDIDKGINDGKNKINDHFAKPCTTDDNC